MFNIILYGVILVAIFLFIYYIIISSLDFKKKKYINEFIGNLNSKYEERLKIREIRELYEGDTGKRKIIDKIDDLVERSGIRIMFHFITSEIFIAISLVVSFIISVMFYKTYPVFILSVGIFISNLLIIVVIMKLMARVIYDKIDDQVLAYINTLDNLCDANDDIVTIFEKAVPYLKEPLQGYSRQFVFECKKGIGIEKAFKNFESKIESKRFRQLLKNLDVCSKHEANYKKVLGKSRVIMKRYFEQKAKRNKAIHDGRVEIALTITMGSVIVYMVSGFNSNLKQILLHTTVGNLILGYNVLVAIIGIYKLLTLDKINY